MLEKLQKKLDSTWIKKNNIWDIVVYGSFARGKSDSRDIDIAVILGKPTPVRKKMILCQQLRKLLPERKLDVKAVDINDFLNKGFLGREAILAEGYSVIKKDYLAERFGFNAVAVIEYSLKGLTPAKQKMFYYAIRGRKKGEGILAKKKGRIIAKGVFQVPVKYYEEIKILLDNHKVNYTSSFTLQYRILH